MTIPCTPSHLYDDIIQLPHPVFHDRKRMSMTERAAQFAPFAALTGYEAVIEETARLTEVETELDESRKLQLDECLQLLRAQINTCPEAVITWYRPDERKSGGSYLQHSGQLAKIDPHRRMVHYKDGTIIPIDQIREIESPLFAYES